MVFLESVCISLLHKFKTLNVVSEHVFGFRGMPLLLRVWLSLDRLSLSWVYDKHGFSGRFVMVICVLKENGEQF